MNLYGDRVRPDAIFMLTLNRYWRTTPVSVVHSLYNEYVVQNYFSKNVANAIVKLILLNEYDTVQVKRIVIIQPIDRT